LVEEELAKEPVIGVHQLLHVRHIIRHCADHQMANILAGVPWVQHNLNLEKK
jgi:hypothetical protein